MAWIERDLTGAVADIEHSYFVEHDYHRAANLLPQFKADYNARFRLSEVWFRDFQVWSRRDVALKLRESMKTPDGSRPHIIGAVPSFDTIRVGQMFDGLGPEPWHYHLIDVENVAMGWLRMRMLDSNTSPRLRKRCADALRPLLIEGKGISSDALSTALGIDPTQFDRHTALGDCRWVRAQWDEMMGKPEPKEQT